MASSSSGAMAMTVEPTFKYIRELGALPGWAAQEPVKSRQWFWVDREKGDYNPKQEGEWAFFWKQEDGTWWEEGSWANEQWHAEAWRLRDVEAAEKATAEAAEKATETGEEAAKAAEQAPEMLLLCFIDCSLVHLLKSSGGCSF